MVLIRNPYSGIMTKCLYCGKSGPKRKQELPEEQQHMACRDEHSKRIREGRCVVCNDKDGWGHSCGDLPGNGYPRRD